MSSLLGPAVLAPVEALINRLLEADPAAARRLVRHGSGKTVGIRCTGPVPWQLTVQINGTRLLLLSASEDSPDCRLSGTAGALSRLLFSDNPQAALYHPDIELGGDTQLIQTLQQVFSDLDIDWADHLSPLLGDVGSQQLSEVVTQARRWSSQAARSLKLTVQEYLQEESGLLPDKQEMAALQERGDALRLRLDRLAARIQLLQQKKDS